MSAGEMYNFFAYVKNRDGEMIVKRIPLNRGLQENLTQSFKERFSHFFPENGGNIFEFEDSIHYKPEHGELLVIRDFEMPEEIINALKNPIDMDTISEREYEKIKSIFCGRQMANGSYMIMFTVFDARKIIKRSKWKTILFYSHGTFSEFENKMIVIDERIDVLFMDENLYFHSFANAKKIFGDALNDYYREATDEEVEEFSNNLFGSKIPEEFIDFRTRKLIFGIMKSRIPDVQRVVQIGREKFGIELEITENGKLAIPENKKDFKKLLKFLNDDMWESPLTGSKYETNSKRRIA